MNTALRSALALVALAGSALSALRAQTSASLDAGVGGTSFGSGRSSLLSVAPAVEWAGSGFRFGATGLYTEYGTRGRGALGRAQASGFLSLAPWLRAELTGAGSGYVLTRSPSVGAWDAGVRLHFGAGQRGFSLGLDRGQAQALAAPGHVPLTRVQANAWGRLGPISIQLLGQQTLLQETVLRTGVAPDTLTPRPDTLFTSQLNQFTDLGGSLRWSAGRLETGLTLGQRLGSGVAVHTWWQLHGLLWLTPRVALVGEGGRYPSDLSLAIRGGHFFTLGVRALLLNRATRPLPVASSAPARAHGLRVQRVDAELVELGLFAPGARSVEVMGDFSDWRPLPLEPDGNGRWSITLPISAGPHQLNLRYDGGAWRPPPGALLTPDEFNGVVGTIVVE